MTSKKMEKQLNVDVEVAERGTRVIVDRLDANPAAGGESKQNPPILFTLNGIPSTEYLIALAESTSRLHQISIPEYEPLRLYNLEHISQELDALSYKVFKSRDCSRDDLDRLRLLLHEQGIYFQVLKYVAKQLLTMFVIAP